jgi:hypothetical protein
VASVIAPLSIWGELLTASRDSHFDRVYGRSGHHARTAAATFAAQRPYQL